MRLFEQLGDDIQARWKTVAFDPDRFQEIALDALTRAPPCQHLQRREVVDAFLDVPRLVPQLPRRFGEPQLTVYEQSRFYIEVLFWVDGATAIHAHGFRGAFHVLAGSSVHSVYGFTPQHRVSRSLLLGQVRLDRVERLRRGDTRAITGASLIHALFHLERPSVTVVARTVGGDYEGPQYTLLPPHVAWDPQLADGALDKRLKLLKLLRIVNAPDAIDRLAEFVEREDLDSAFRALHDAWDDLAESERLETVLKRGRARHGEWFDRVTVSLERERQAQDIKLRREDVLDPGHRMLLALLLNVPEREPLLRLVAEEQPGDPVETVMRWVRELTVIGDDGSVDLLGLVVTPEDTPHADRLDEPLGETLHRAIRALVDGGSPERLCDLLQQHNPRLSPEQAAALLDNWSPLGTSLLQPLFTAARGEKNPP